MWLIGLIHHPDERRGDGIRLVELAGIDAIRKEMTSQQGGALSIRDASRAVLSARRTGALAEDLGLPDAARDELLSVVLVQGAPSLDAQIAVTTDGRTTTMSGYVVTALFADQSWVKFLSDANHKVPFAIGSHPIEGMPTGTSAPDSDTTHADSIPDFADLFTRLTASLPELELLP